MEVDEGEVVEVVELGTVGIGVFSGTAGSVCVTLGDLLDICVLWI